MSALEDTYRRVIRWYPKHWREQNADAVVGTLLDRAEDEKRTAPTRGELADLRASAIVTRLGPIGRIPANVRDRAAALAFGLGSGLAITGLIAMAIQKSEAPAFWLTLVPVIGPFIGYNFLFYGAWILALVAALAGWKWTARALALASVLVAIVIRIVASGSPAAGPTTTTILLVGSLAIMSLIGNPFESSRARLWIAAATAAWAVFVGVTLWYQRVTLGGAAGREDWFVGTLWLWLQFVVPLALIAALVVRSVRSSPWANASLILLFPLTVFVVFAWPDGFGSLVERATPFVILIGAICAVYLAARLFTRRRHTTRV